MSLSAISGESPKLLSTTFNGDPCETPNPARITGRNPVKVPLNYPSQPDSRIPTIFVCSVRSLAPKIDELECVVNQNDSDIVCITETWLSNDIPDDAIALKDFTLIRKGRERRGGGIARFVKSNIQVKDL